MVSKHVPLNQNPEYDAHREASFIKLKPLFMYIDAVYSVQFALYMVHGTRYTAHGTRYTVHGFTLSYIFLFYGFVNVI